MISDKEIEKIYELIDDFDNFKSLVIKKEDVKLSEDIMIYFKSDTNVYIQIYNKVFNINESNFLSILRDIESQQKLEIEQVKCQKDRDKKEKKSNELTKINDFLYKAEFEFYQKFCFTRETATSYPIYQRMLAEIISVFKKGGKIIFDNKTYKSEKEFIEKYLSKLHGFQDIERELK